MKRILGWGAIAVTALFVAFNFQRANVWFFGIRVEMPLGLVVIGSAVLGVLASFALSSLKTKR